MNNTTCKRLVTLIVAAAITTAAFVVMLNARDTASGLRPIAGKLDLAKWDAGGDDELILNGEWHFYWNRFLTYRELGSATASPDLTVYVPSVWSDRQIGDESLPGFGYGTYHLHVENAPVGRPLAIRLQTVASSYELFIDDMLISACGEVGIDKEHASPRVEPQVAEFTPVRQDFDCLIHVANFSYAQGGMPYAPCLGTAEQIRQMNQAIADQDLLLFGAMTIMAFYFFCVSLLRRTDRSGLFFVLMCVLLAGLTVITGSLYMYRLIPNIGYDAIIAILFMILIWLSVCVAFGVGALFPEEKSRAVLGVTLFYAVIMTPLVLLNPVSFYSRIIGVAYAAEAIIDAYLLAALAVAFVRGRKDALTLLLAMLVAVLCWTHDLLFQSGAGRLSLLLILLTLSFILARRFAESFQTLKASVDKTVAAETAFMQAQIKPHFLYNTLNTISSFCDTDPGKAQKLIDDFSEYLQESFDFKSPDMFTPLSREIDLIRSYIEIEKARFGHELCVDFDVDAAIECKIPTLSIQPLVENAISHGLRKKSRAGTIRLSVKKNGSHVWVAVQDNGQGIPEDRLKTLISPEASRGIGLWNIDSRLKNLYGKGLTIESKAGEGTTVSFSIPLGGDAV